MCLCSDFVWGEQFGGSEPGRTFGAGLLDPGTVPILDVFAKYCKLSRLSYPSSWSFGKEKKGGSVQYKVSRTLSGNLPFCCYFQLQQHADAAGATDKLLLAQSPPPLSFLKKKKEGS